VATAKKNDTGTAPSNVTPIDDEMMTRYEALAKRAQEDRPKPWAPHMKDSTDDATIVGRFVRMDMGRTNYGPNGIVILELPDGSRRSVWLLHQVLRNEFARQRPNKGDIVAVSYLGTTEGDDFTYTNWRVEVESDQAQDIDWSKIAVNDSRDDDDTIPY
jgi:hypothetical protein